VFDARAQEEPNDKRAKSNTRNNWGNKFHQVQ
jgi:hypothetical protein